MSSRAHMKFQEDALILVRLGLTKSQANVYFSLLKTGKATAKIIANFSKIARQEVYRILEELYEKGLVEKIITKPTEFKAISIEECLNILIERKKRELYEIKNKAIELRKKLEEKQENTVQDSAQFVLYLEKGKYFQNAKKTFVETKKSINAITTPERFQSVISFFNEEIKKALERRVKFRIIIKNTDKKESPLDSTETLKTFMNNPLLSIKYIHVPSKEILWITDDKEVTIVTTPEASLKESTILWTNNEVIRGIIQNYFETLWNSATENNHK